MTHQSSQTDPILSAPADDDRNPRRESEFDSFAENYDQALQQGLSVSGESKDYFASERVKWLTHRLAQYNFSTKTVVDFGCGTGGTIPFLNEYLTPDRIIGLDISTDSLAVAKKKYAGPHVQFETMDAFDQNGDADLCYCNGVFHHIPVEDRHDTARRILEMLSPGGYLAFWENNPWNPGTRLVMRRIPFDRDAVTLSYLEARSLLLSAGFEIIEIDFRFVFPRLLSWFRRFEPLLGRFPIGAQYLVLARKPKRE